MREPEARQVGGHKRSDAAAGALGEVVREVAPVGGVDAGGGDGDGRREDFGGVPPSCGYEENFAGMKLELDRSCFGVERELLEIHVFDIGDGGAVGVGIEERGLVRRKNCVLLHAVDLAKESVNVPGVVMENGEFASGAANVEFETAAMQA